MVNLALHKPTHPEITPIYQGEKRHRTSNAVDGMRNNDLSITDNWWMVDLEGYYLIWEVDVTNPSDCCGRSNKSLLNSKSLN